MTPKQPNDFVISLAGLNIDVTIINIEEMAGYCTSRQRLANVITEKQTYGELDKMNYSLIMNYTKPKPRVVGTKDKQFLLVFNVLSEKYKKGLLIVETDTISEPISEHLCTNDNWNKNDIDIMICRDITSVTKEELMRSNLLRISADPDFDISILQKHEDVLKEKVLSLMVCQLFVNDNYDTVQRYLEIKNKHYAAQGITEYIDYYELNKQLAYFVYFDMKENKILNIERPVIKAFMEKLSTQGILPLQEFQIDQLSEMITY